MGFKKPIFFTVLVLGGILLFEVLLNSCASRSAPSGGPRDTLAPVLDTSFPPNMSLNFESKNVVLVFNEYLQLKSPDQQISFSPPLKNKPEISLKGKELTISWEEDTLLENTTYIISFGTALADYTEGNVNEKLKYVFSTGDFIDSLSLGGSVLDILDASGVDNIMVGLYDLNTLREKDSIPFNNLPTYYAYTDENGIFSLSNLKYGRFHVVAFEDMRGNFKMSSGKEKVAFTNDTISTSLEPKRLDLKAFSPASPQRFYGARHSGKGHVQLSFNYTPKELRIDFADSALAKNTLFTENAEGDTINLWFERGERDSLVLWVKEGDKPVDTAEVTFKDYDEELLVVNVENTDVKYNKPIRLKASAPVRAIYDSLILLLSPADTSRLKLVGDSTDIFQKYVQPQSRPEKYQLCLKAGAVEDIFGRKSDSVIFDMSSLKRADLGNLDFTVKVDSTAPVVLHVFDPSDKKIIDTAFTASVVLKLHNMEPGEYKFKLIVDDNGDGKWTTGSYFDRRQPERIIDYRDKAEIRANWDLDLEWRPSIGGPPGQSRK